MSARGGIATGRQALAVVVGVALTARIAVLLATPGYRPIHDDHSYATIARSLLSTGGYPLHHVAGGMEPSTYRPPGWPVFLASLWGIAGAGLPVARVALVVLGTVTCVLAAHVTRRLAGDAAGLAAGLVLALDPLLLALGATLESETLFTAFALGAVAAALECRRADRWAGWAALAGGLVGAAALTRTNGLALIPVVAWISLGGRGRPPFTAAAVVTAAAVLVIAPWTVRNALAVHRFVPVSSETGNTLAGTYNTASLRHGARWLEPTRTGAYHSLYRRLGAGAVLDAALVPAVGRWVLRHPAYPLVVSADNTRRLLGFAGTGWAAMSLRTMSLGARGGRLVGLGTAIVSLLAVAAVVLPGRARKLAPLLVAGVVLLLTAAPVNGELRLGGPPQAVLGCAAGVALAAGAARMRQRHGP